MDSKSSATENSIYRELRFIIPAAPNSDFPTDILRWIKTNTNPLLSLKLMKCCKYFCYKTFPYLVVTHMRYTDIHIFKRLQYNILNKKWIDVNQNALPKIWITGDCFCPFKNIESFPVNPLTPRIIENIVANDIIYLSFYSYKRILFNNFKILTSSKKLKKIFVRSHIYKSDGGRISLEDLFACVPFAEEIKLAHHLPSINCVETALKFFPSDLQSLSLSFADETFNFDNFVELVKKKPQVEYGLQYVYYNLQKEYNKKLKKYVKRMVKIGVTEHPPLNLTFYAQNWISEKAIENLRKAYEEQKMIQKNVEIKKSKKQLVISSILAFLVKLNF